MITYKKFRQQLLEFLENANANLGRRTCKPRKEFIMGIMQRIDDFHDFGKTKVDYESTSACSEAVPTEKVPTKPDQSGLRPDVIKVLKPTDKQRGLAMGKGVHAMTASESMRADEDLNRSPLAGRNKKENKTDD